MLGLPQGAALLSHFPIDQTPKKQLDSTHPTPPQGLTSSTQPLVLHPHVPPESHSWVGVL